MRVDKKPRARRRVALVTGASSGIGEAMCRLLAREYHDLIITARREERLITLRKELAPIANVHVVPLDLGQPQSPLLLYEAALKLGLSVDILINNAGYALPGAFLQTDWLDQARLMQVLATSPAELIHLFAPQMVARGFGRVLNVASIGAFAPASPNTSLYAALKHFVLVMNLSLQAEHEGSGVSFTALCPGPTATEWADKADMGAAFKSLPKSFILSADQVARMGYDAMMRGDSRVITGAPTRMIAALLPLIPEKWSLKWLKGASSHT